MTCFRYKYRHASAILCVCVFLFRDHDDMCSVILSAAAIKTKQNKTISGSKSGSKKTQNAGAFSFAAWKRRRQHGDRSDTTCVCLFACRPVGIKRFFSPSHHHPSAVFFCSKVDESSTSPRQVLMVVNSPLP